MDTKDENIIDSPSSSAPFNDHEAPRELMAEATTSQPGTPTYSQPAPRRLNVKKKR